MTKYLHDQLVWRWRTLAASQKEEKQEQLVMGCLKVMTILIDNML